MQDFDVKSENQILTVLFFTVNLTVLTAQET